MILLKTIGLILMAVLFTGELTTAEESQSNPDSYTPKKYKTATIGAGDSYSSPMSTDRKTIEEFVIERARLMCSADGPNSSRYATDVVGLEAFQTSNNLKCVELYLLGVHELHYEGEGSRIEKKALGPFYAVQLSGEDESYRALFLRLNGWGETASGEDVLLKKIVDTVHVLNP